MTLAQLGADVIRFDTIGGGLDYHRWPVTDEGVSLYWAGLNKGKRSIADRPAQARGPGARSPRSSPPPATTPACSSRTSRSRAGSPTSACAPRRADLVYVNIVGNPDGSTAVDYTVNASSGIALATGPVGSLFPVNHALPAWDIATGLNAAIGLLAAERHRRRPVRDS